MLFGTILTIDNAKYWEGMNPNKITIIICELGAIASKSEFNLKSNLWESISLLKEDHVYMT